VLDRTGAIALAPKPGGLRLVPVRQVQRIWLGHWPVAAEIFVPKRGTGVEGQAAATEALAGP
jgi:hypothetical protein